MDSLGDYLKRNDEVTIINRVCEQAAEDHVLNAKELEQVREELLDDFYTREGEIRKHAYLTIAEIIFKAATDALDEGKFAESIAIGDVYNQWIEVCIKAGVM